METMETGELEAFVEVVKAGSFTAAAGRRGTRKAHLSRLVSRLEQRLQARLLNRTTRSLSLTEVGREVFERAKGVLSAMDETVRVVERTRSNPTGTLRVTCGVEFGLLAVQRWITAYLARWPDVRVETDFTNRVVDVVHEGFDVAIRVGALEDSTLSARKLGVVDGGLFATPAYLKQHGAPRRFDELHRHALVLSTQTRRGRAWPLLRDGEERALHVEPRLLVNTHLAAREAALAGVGIALVPVFQVAEWVRSGKLVRVLDGWGPQPAPVHAVFPGQRFLSPRVRAFVDLAAADSKTFTAAARWSR